MAKKITLKIIKDHIAITQYGTDCNDLKSFSWGHTGFFNELKFFLKSEYIKYLKQDIEENKPLSIIKDNIDYYWAKFKIDIQYLNLV